LLIGITTAMIATAQPQATADQRCKMLQQELTAKQRLLDEYLNALQSAYNDKDLTLADAISYRISQLQKELNALKQLAADCPSPGAGSAPAGLNPTKSDESQLADKSCDEIRKTLFALLRRVNSLKKREKSLLSSLTPEEELELSEAIKQLKTLNQVLETRCTGKEQDNSKVKRPGSSRSPARPR